MDNSHMHLPATAWPLLVTQSRRKPVGEIDGRDSTARLPKHALPKDRVDSLVADFFFVVEGADVG
jgi:hypothetical protein